MGAALKTRISRVITSLLILLLFATTAKQARADIVSKTDVTLIFVAVAAVGAAIAVGVVFAVRHNPSLKGCAWESPSGLQVVNESDSRTWLLTGDTAAVKPGDRVRVSGKKKKVKSGEPPQLIVEKFKKDYGVCHAAPAAP